MLTPPDDEKNIGIKCFLTQTPGINGRLRVLAEDFVVDEQSIYPREKKQGRFVIARVTARNWETNHLVNEISNRLHIPAEKIKFAGTKDKHAVTTQLLSFEASEDAVKNIDLKDVTFEKIYCSDKPLKIGLLKGNKFIIKIRRITLDKRTSYNRLDKITSSLLDTGVFPNFYGVQRFGSVRPITHLVGKHIVKGDFEKAVMTYVANPMSEKEAAYDLRRFVQETRDFEAALRRFPKYLSYERMMLKQLVKKPDDFVNALKALPKNLLLMFIHAYQSYIFNLILSRRIKTGLPLHEATVGDVVIPASTNPRGGHRREITVTERNRDKVNTQLDKNNAFVSGILLGTKTSFSSGEMGNIERTIVEQEGINANDFVIPEMPFLSSSGSRRAIAAPLNNLMWEIHEDDVADGNNAVELQFELPKGCYATSLLREIMKCRDITHY